MSSTDVVLLLLVILFIIYCLYDEFIMNKLKGRTKLRIKLKKRNKLDTVLFIILLSILIYQNSTSLGTALTNYLLFSLILISFYCFFIRYPKLLFKQDGFFYGNLFLRYSLIKQINLSEDGILVFDLNTRRLLIYVDNLDDLTKILNLFTEQNIKTKD